MYAQIPTRPSLCRSSTLRATRPCSCGPPECPTTGVLLSFWPLSRRRYVLMNTSHNSGEYDSTFFVGLYFYLRWWDWHLIKQYLSHSHSVSSFTWYSGRSLLLSAGGQARSAVRVRHTDRHAAHRVRPVYLLFVSTMPIFRVDRG
jgi:hypothetical protein